MLGDLLLVVCLVVYVDLYLWCMSEEVGVVGVV